MKKAFFTIASALVIMTSADCLAAKPKDQKKQQVKYVTTLHCEKCAAKISENVSFEKGVKDLKTNVEDKTVTIVFDPAKTDTLKLADAIRKLGYKAKVEEFSEVK